MSIEPEPDLELEIAHVLLIDVVGYSKLLVNEQIVLMQALNRAVREAPHFRAAEASGKLMRLPTGDGMALLFFDSPETPVRCALEISQAVRDRPEIQIRMGAHSGAIKEVTDVNDKPNFAGAGINLAQRVLDCGDAGHILLTKRLADDLSAYRHWHACLHDLGECEVKHGLKLHLFNLCKDGLGNPSLPDKIRCQRGVLRRWRTSTGRWAGRSKLRQAILVAGYAGSALALALGLWFLAHRPVTSTDDRDFASIAENSIAVLPFGVLGGDQESGRFSDAVQDNILTNLSKMADLKVPNRFSVMKYSPGVVRDVRQIALALGVAYLLEGSVQHSDRGVVINARLIDARTGRNVWGNSYEATLGEFKDLFAIQNQMARQIVAQLALKLSPDEKNAMEDLPTSDRAAYELYVRAKELIDASVFSARRKNDLTEAEQLLQRAILLDNTFALAYYQLAHVHDQIYHRGGLDRSRLALADKAIQTLQRLRPDSGEAHLALAKHLYWGYLDYDRARLELTEAGRKLHNDPLIPLFAAYIDRREGQWEQSTQNFYRALELVPQNPFILQQLALSYQKLRRFREMASVLDRALKIAPDDLALRAQRATVDLEWRAETRPLRHLIDSIAEEDQAAASVIADMALYLALYERNQNAALRALNILGEDGCQSEGVPFPRSWCEGIAARSAGDANAASVAFEKAGTEAAELVIAQPTNAGAFCALGMINAARGRKSEAIRAGEEAVALLPVSKDAVDGSIMIEHFAIILAYAGEKDRALEQLAAAATMPSNVSYGNLRLHPYWDPLRGDPRFEKIVASLAPK